MSDQGDSSVPYSVPREPGRWRAIALAAVVHAALFAFLWFGVRWQNETPVAVEAEVWSPQALEAARKAPPPPPEPEPEPVPQVQRPQPKPQPPREVPPPVEVPVQKAPDIALEREKKRLEQRKQQANIDAQQEEQDRKRKLLQLAEQQREQKRAEERAQEREKERIQEREKEREKERDDKRLAARQEAEKKREKEHAAQLAEAEARKKLEDAKKLAAEKQRKMAAAADQKLEAQHAEQVRRLMESASASTSSSARTGSGGNGEAARSQGSRADASYTQKVGAKIKSNTIFNGAEELSSNPAVEFSVELLPDGSIRRLRKTKASGVPGFDEAVSRAIEKSQPFPPDKSGTAPSGFTVSHKPKDQ